MWCASSRSRLTTITTTLTHPRRNTKDLWISCLLLSVSSGCHRLPVDDLTPARYPEESVEVCHKRLSSLYGHLVLLQDRRGNPKRLSGTWLYCAMRDEYEPSASQGSEDFMKMLSCPGGDLWRRGTAGKSSHSHSSDQLCGIDSNSTSYAWRDLTRFSKIGLSASDEALVACDNEHTLRDGGQPNHPDSTLALMADGSIIEYRNSMLRELGILGARSFPVPGPSCPIEALRKLTLGPPRLGAEEHPK